MPASATNETEIQADRRQRRFLRRVTLATACGEGLDGYDLGIISVVLLSISRDLHTSTVWAGLIGASSLIGIFIGGPLFGRVTDRFGRRRPFLVNIVCFVVLGVAQAFVQSVEQLFVVRLLLGMAIGAEYAIGGPMLAEFAPAERRVRLSAWLIAFWYIGFLVPRLPGHRALAALPQGHSGPRSRDICGPGRDRRKHDPVRRALRGPSPQARQLPDRGTGPVGSRALAGIDDRRQGRAVTQPPPVSCASP